MYTDNPVCGGMKPDIHTNCGIFKRHNGHISTQETVVMWNNGSRNCNKGNSNIDASELHFTMNCKDDIITLVSSSY